MRSENFCGARLSHGRGRCRARPAKGRARCRFHGGASTGPRTREGMQCTITAMVAGRKRWLEEMQRAKALDLIDKIPTGQRRPGIRKAPTKTMARARGWIAAERERWPVLETKPFDELSEAEQLDVLQRKALNILCEILNEPDDPGSSKPQHVQSHMRLKLNVALYVMRLQARVDPDRLRHRDRPNSFALMRESLAAIKVPSKDG